MKNNNNIKEMLLFLNECYKKRDSKNIDILSKMLFNEKHPPIIIGTSIGEWCLNLEEAKKLLIDDWEGWGNVVIDVDSVISNELENLNWFKVNATIEYNFVDSIEKYNSYMDLVVKIAKSNKPNLIKMSEINWFLVHLLHNRKDEPRKYLWDLTISGILQKVDNELKVRLMQFSIPTKNLFSDIRIDVEIENKIEFDNENKRLIEYTKKHQILKSEKITKAISTFFNGNYILEQDSFFIGFDGEVYNTKEFNKYFNNYCNNSFNFQIEKESIIINQVDSEFYFCGMGAVTKDIVIDNELNKVLENIDYYSEFEDKKDALFKLRRDLALVLKESIVFNKHSAPFRFEGVGKIIDNKEIVFSYIQFSYPFYWILEQKTDAAKEI